MPIARVQDAHLPLPTDPLPTFDIVKDIALVCLKELAVTLVLGTAVSCFVPTSAGLTVVATAAMVQFAVSVFFHSLGAFTSCKSFCEWMNSLNFALFTGFNFQTLIHETGHMLASLSIYKRPQPRIAIYPFMGGLTQFHKTALSAFGKKIGPVAATFFLVISGPGLTLLISSVLLGVGLAMKERYPLFSKYLIGWSIFDFLHHAEYAFTALGAETTTLNHDFVHLAVFGLHPVAATIAILAIPIVITLGMHWREKRLEV